MTLSHTIETPTNRAGAVSVLRVWFNDAHDANDAFSKLGITSFPIGGVRLVSIFGIDEALVARFDEGSMLIMPHGGIGVTRSISNALEKHGFNKCDVDDVLTKYPEADSLVEARMLDALSRASSPLAVDVLLEQTQRWESHGSDSSSDDSFVDSEVLDRLIVPAMVVVVGRSNIGKSSLVNTLAGSEVSLVVDHEGTTRDHVGVLINLAGLVVRWIDTPGIDERVELGGELGLLEPVIQSADLIIHAIDAADPDGVMDPRLSGMIGDSVPVFRLGIRSDLESGSADLDHSCSSKTGKGIAAFAGMVREMLVPQNTLDDPRPWRFWTRDC